MSSNPHRERRWTSDDRMLLIVFANGFLFGLIMGLVAWELLWG